MRIDRTDLYHVELCLVRPYVTRFEQGITRRRLLVAAHAEGRIGWGDCPVTSWPGFSYETVETAWHVLRDFLVPALLHQELGAPGDLPEAFERVRGHPLAKAALECAVWDLHAQVQGLPLATLLGGSRDRVEVGAAIGLEPTKEALLRHVAQCVSAGYRRVKLKIKPGWDTDIVRAVRERWPELPLLVDGNGSYTLAHVDVFQTLDQFGLLVIEQPLHHQDIVDHARLQSQLKTPIGLDESIQSPEHARWALDIQACRAINIKLSRVGGLAAAVQIHDLCAKRNIPVWCGGMAESNIGRAAAVALASLPNFTLPSDTAASDRYYQRDVASPGFLLGDDSTLPVPREPGLGVHVDLARVESLCVRHASLTA